MDHGSVYTFVQDGCFIEVFSHLKSDFCWILHRLLFDRVHSMVSLSACPRIPSSRHNLELSLLCASTWWFEIEQRNKDLWMVTHGAIN